MKNNLDNLDSPMERLHQRPCVFVCQHHSCVVAGAEAVLAAFGEETAGYKVVGCECLGQCSTSPTVRVTPEEIWYYRVQPEDVPLIIEQHLQGGTPVEAKMNPRIHLRFHYGG